MQGKQGVTHGLSYRAHDRVSQCLTKAHGRATGAHGRARVIVQNFRFSLFRHFAHKIPIVYLISILFSPTRSNHLNISQSTQKSCFPNSNQLNPISPNITYSPKTIKNDFYTKISFSPKRLNTQNLCFKTEIQSVLIHSNNIVNSLKTSKTTFLHFDPF